ncbi:MAG: DedA family protein [Gaiellales bacterium]
MNDVLDLARHYGYVAVFFPIVLELAGIPFPSETILLTAGAAASTGRLNLALLMLVAAAAAVVGGFVGYGLGRLGGRRLLSVLEGRVLASHHVERVDRFFERHGGKTLVFVRFLPWVRIAAFWMAGTSGMPRSRFIPWNLVGGVVWAVTITLIGYVFADSLRVVERTLGTGGVVVGLAGGVVALVLWQRRMHAA